LRSPYERRFGRAVNAIVLLGKGNPNHPHWTLRSWRKNRSRVLVLRIPKKVGIVVIMGINALAEYLPRSDGQRVVFAPNRCRIICEHLSLSINRRHAAFIAIHHDRSSL